jgi:glycosyltransferase involved in cell wall biosynthesis
LNKTLSLCIPAYNAESYLPRLLISAKNQLVPFDEIIVYDDCSTDNTIAVARRYGAKVISGKVNMGCSHGKNIMADASACEWIHFHDADDELLPNFTTLAHKWLQKPDCADIVLFNYEYRDHQTGELLSIRTFDKIALEKDPLAYAIAEQINPFCGLYNKHSFLKAGGYDTDPLVLFNEDAAFHIKMAIAKLRFSVEEEISIINYRINSSMSSTNKQKCLIAQFHVLEKTANKTQLNYADEISTKLWGIIGLFAAAKKWNYVKRIITLCKHLGYQYPHYGNWPFKIMAYINPFFAVWSREKMIRIFKAQLRKDY